MEGRKHGEVHESATGMLIALDRQGNNAFEARSRFSIQKGCNKAKKRGVDMVEPHTVPNRPCNEERLGSRHRGHALSGAYAGFRECRIRPNWLLITQLTKEGPQQRLRERELTPICPMSNQGSWSSGRSLVAAQPSPARPICSASDFTMRGGGRQEHPNTAPPKPGGDSLEQASFLPF